MILDYALPQWAKEHVTESYVSSPPAMYIIDERGDVWMLGLQYAVSGDKLKERYETREEGPRGEFSFNVLRNNKETGEFASRIERRNGKVRIFTRSGWKVWNGQSFI